MRSPLCQESVLRVAGPSVVILALVYLLMPEFTLGVQENLAAIDRRVVVAEVLSLRTTKGTNAATLRSGASGHLALNFGTSDQGPGISLRVLGDGGGPVIDLEDDKSQTRVSLGTLPKGSFLQAVKDRGVEEQAGIFTPFDGVPTILAERPQGRLRLSVLRERSPSAQLSFFTSMDDAKHEQIFIFTDFPYVGLADSSGKARTSMNVQPNTGGAGLFFSDSEKRVRLLAGMEANGNSVIGISDRAGRTVREIP